MDELKFFDTTLQFTVDATGEVPATGQLCLIPQGDTKSTRNGRKATITSIEIKGAVALVPAAAATASDIAHIFVVLDTQANGAAAAATNVFTTNTFQASFPNLDNEERFVILDEICLTLNAASGVSGAYNVTAKNVDWSMECEIDIDWSGATGAITEIRSNNIFLLAGTAQGSDDLINFDGICRVRFLD